MLVTESDHAPLKVKKLKLYHWSCIISFQQGSPWSNEISLAILNFHESGVMEELETTWIDTKKCDEQSNSPATLGLNHMLGMYSKLEASVCITH